MGVKEAYAILYDEETKKAYDSSLPFDEDTPSFLERPSTFTFYSQFGPVFDRNARFSSIQPVPSLGGEDTPIDEVLIFVTFNSFHLSTIKVHGFYTFWTRFESWRDFSMVAAAEEEVDVEEGESRWERRFLMKSVKKRAKELKRAENRRVGDLVQEAMKWDPRLLREKEEREEMKRERREERERLEREEQEREEREQKEKEEEEQRQRDEKKRLKEERRRVKGV